MSNPLGDIYIAWCTGVPGFAAADCLEVFKLTSIFDSILLLLFSIPLRCFYSLLCA